MTNTVTIEEAYKAMYLYLENLYQLTGSDVLAGFLGGMSIMPDGRPADGAVWEDWLDALKKARLDPDLDLSLRSLNADF